MRDRIARIQADLRDGDPTPERARDYLTELSALYGNVLSEQLHADAAYNVVLLKYLDTDEAAARAKIRAECSPEYLRAREAANTLKLVTKMTSALSAMLRSLSEEMRLSR